MITDMQGQIFINLDMQSIYYDSDMQGCTVVILYYAGIDLFIGA